MKILFFDVETTGLDPVSQDIIQFAWILDIDGDIVEEGNYLLPPLNLLTVAPEAVAISGIDLSPWKDTLDLDRRNLVLESKRAWESIWAKHVDKFDRADKMYPSGYNGFFDYQFLAALYRKLDDPYFGSWVNHRLLDPLAIFRFREFLSTDRVPDMKLATMARKYDIPLVAHDALSDVRATRQLLYILKKESQHGLSRQLSQAYNLV